MSTTDDFDTIIAFFDDASNAELADENEQLCCDDPAKALERIRAALAAAQATYPGEKAATPDMQAAYKHQCDELRAQGFAGGIEAAAVEALRKMTEDKFPRFGREVAAAIRALSPPASAEATCKQSLQVAPSAFTPAGPCPDCDRNIPAEPHHADCDFAPAASAPAGAPRWRHKKRGTFYTEVARVSLQASDPGGLGDNDTMVVYRGDDGQWWVRPEWEFMDGRFEPLEPAPAGAPSEWRSRVGDDVRAVIEEWYQDQKITLTVEQIDALAKEIAECIPSS